MGSVGALKLAVVPDESTPGGLDVTGTAASRTASGKAQPPRGSATWPKALRLLWNQVSDQLDEAGLSSAVDGMALELTLRHFLAARHAADAMMEGQVVVEDGAHGPGNVKKNPAGAEFRSQSLAYLEYAKQLGLTLNARARITVTDDAKETGENPFA